MLVDKIKLALTGSDSRKDLETLVLDFSDQGMTRQTIYNLFLQYRNENIHSADWIEIENKNNEDHPIDILLDRLSGWCYNDSLLEDEPFENK